MRFSIASAGAAVAIAVALTGCGGSSKTAAQSNTAAQRNTQQQIGARVGQDFVRIQRAFAQRPGAYVTAVGFVSEFDAWISGQAGGKDVPQDVKSAGYATNPAPSTPLSRRARMAAAAVALQYLAHATTPKYGRVDGGYLVAFRDDQLEFRCKSRGNPPSDDCKGSRWQQWQHGF